MPFDREQLKSYLPGLAVTIFGVTAVVILSSVLSLDGWWPVALIVLALLVWPIALVIDRVFKKRGQTAAPAAEPSPSAPRKTNQSFPDLEQASARAINWLREKLSGKESPGARASSGRGWFGAKLGGDGDALYQRPWFVIAGPRSSGKTSLLLSAGLNFHALQGEIRTEQNLLRPTPACEWRITDNLVLLDTSGRYQDEHFQRDHDEWLAFIDLVKRHRRRRPLDGLLLVVNAAEVINAERQGIEQQANILRDRLDELILQTRGRFPVYLVFTHTDQIAGFTEFFRNCDPSERAQVWGASFKASEARNQLGKLDEEFNQLYDNLLRRRLVRLGIPDQAAEQSRVFDFPFRFRDERRKFFWFISMLFQTRPHNKEQQPLLRGFYFTSSPVVPTADGQKAGQSYFTSNIFRTLLTGDRHLAAYLQPGRWMDQYARPALLALAGFALLFLTAGLLISFDKNREAIRKGQELGQAVLEAEKSNDDARVWAELDKLRDFLKGQEENSDLTQRFGLNAGEDFNRPLRAIYFEAISQRVFNPAVSQIENDLRKFGDDPTSACGGQLSSDAVKCDTLYYKLLRAYQMLSLSVPMKRNLLVEQLEPYWRKAAPALDPALLSQQLGFYADHAGSAGAPHWPTSRGVAEKALNHLRNYPEENRYFDAITGKTDEQLSSERETFAAIFRSDWLTSTSPAVPGSFTLKGYEQLRSRLDSISQDVAEEEGLTNKGEKLSREKVQKLYADEYSRQWEKFISAVEVRPFPKDNESLRKAFDELASSESPLVRLLNKVAEQTGQVAPPPRAWWDFFGSAPTSPPKEVVDKFKPLAAFIAKDEKSGLAQYIKALQSLQSKLNEIVREGKPLTEPSLKTALVEAQGKVDKIAEPLKKDPTQSTIPVADLLQKPLASLRRVLEGDEMTRLRAEWQGFGNSIRVMAAQYPFNRGSRTDASPEEIKRLFNPVNGVLANLVKQLEKYLAFEPATNQWRRKDDQSFPPQEVINYLNRAAQMQEAFFPNQSADLRLGYTLTVRSLPSGATVEINGVRLAAQNQSVPATWPPSGVTGIVVTQNGSPVAVPDASGVWGIFRLVDRSNGKNANIYSFSPGQVQMTLQYNSRTDPFDRQLFSQLGNVPPLQ